MSFVNTFRDVLFKSRCPKTITTQLAIEYTYKFVKDIIFEVSAVDWPSVKFLFSEFY